MMIERKEKLNFVKSREISASADRYLPGKAPVFLDIETTGLGWRSSHIYLVGMLYQEEDGWLLHQCFLRRPFCEKEMLEHISGVLEALGPRFCVHYNGDGFDLPYLRNKYTYYGLPCPELLSETKEGLDILRKIRPYRSALGLFSLRQKDVERFLDLKREDKHTGSELINVYQEYLISGDDGHLLLLFRHNHDDLLGMSDLLSMLAYPLFFSGAFCIKEAVLEDDGLHVTLHAAHAFPKSLSLTPEDPETRGALMNNTDPALSVMKLSGETAKLRVPFYRGELKYFYENYRDYYYLPAEDTAYHKSVAVYTDRAHREKARASTCYRRVQGRFLPLPPGACASWISGMDMPVYRSGYRSKHVYFIPDESWLGQESSLKSYVRSFFKTMRPVVPG